MSANGPSRLTSRFGVMLVCCVAGSAALAGGASARQVYQERLHVERTAETENFCGVAGLTVSEDFTVDAMVQAVQRGRDRLEYFAERGRETTVSTNLANDMTVTLVTTFAGRDLHLTDNGDGTLTATTFGTGNTVLYGADGKALARNPGQSRFELRFDHGGTPNDPSDDELLTFELVHGSTGRNDDICAAAVAALT